MTDYTPELGLDICTRLAEGNSLVKVCRELGVQYRSVFDWIGKIPEFAHNYARAREVQTDYLAEQVIDVADNEAIEPEHKRIMVDSRKWYAGKMKPKKYGDSTQIKHADADGNKLTVSSILHEISGTSSGLPSPESKAD